MPPNDKYDPYALDRESLFENEMLEKAFEYCKGNIFIYNRYI